MSEVVEESLLNSSAAYWRNPKLINKMQLANSQDVNEQIAHRAMLAADNLKLNENGCENGLWVVKVNVVDSQYWVGQKNSNEFFCCPITLVKSVDGMIDYMNSLGDNDEIK